MEYDHTDALGSVRVVTKVVNGQMVIVSRHHFMPFGEEVNPPTPPNLADKRLFTGHEHDFETGQDYFNARQLVAAYGRFTSVDPLGTLPVVFGDPERYNGYAYAGNNPLRFVDPWCPSLASLAAPAGNTAALVQYDSALAHAAERALTYPNKSSIFRSKMAGARSTLGVAFWGGVVLAEGEALVTEIRAVRAGVCQ